MANEIAENAGSGKTPVESENLSADQFAHLLGAETDQPEAENPAEDETEEADTEEVEETTEEAEESEETEDETEANSEIDFDSLTPEQWEVIAKKIGSKAAKRIAKLTREKREAEEKLQSQPQQAEANPLQKPKTVENPRIAAIKTVEELSKEQEQAEEVEEWAQNILDANGPAAADEVVFEEDGKRYTKEQVIAIRNGARKAQKRDIPARLEEIQRAEQLQDLTEKNDAAALSMIPELGEDDSPVKATYEALMNDPVLKKAIQATPELRAVAGIAMAHAARSVTLLKQQAKAKPKAATATGQLPKPKVPTAPSGAGAAPSRPGASKGKDVEAKRQKFEGTGNPDDFAAYLAAGMS